MNWKTFFKTLGMAAGGGGLTAVLATVATGSIDPKQIRNAAIGGAAATAIAYLKQSPLGQYLPPAQQPPKER